VTDALENEGIRIEMDGKKFVAHRASLSSSSGSMPNARNKEPAAPATDPAEVNKE